MRVCRKFLITKSPPRNKKSFTTFSQSQLCLKNFTFSCFLKVFGIGCCFTVFSFQELSAKDLISFVKDLLETWNWVFMKKVQEQIRGNQIFTCLGVSCKNTWKFKASFNNFYVYSSEKIIGEIRLKLTFHS